MTKEEQEVFCQAAIEEFSGLYDRDEENIKALLDYFYSSNQRVCIWGIGKKAVVFVTTFDDEKKYIKKLVDTDDKKIGMELPTGHVIEKPETLLEDEIILVVQDIKNAVDEYLLYNFRHPGMRRTLMLTDYLDGKWALDDIKDGKAMRRKKYYEL